MSIAEGVATNLVQRLVEGTINEVQYLCCFKSNLENFETERDRLRAKRGDLQKDIEDAQKRNEIQIEDVVKQWIDEADPLLQEDTKTKRKWFYGQFPNCIWQYQQGKKFAKMTQDATNLIKKCKFNRVARPAELPGIKFHASPDFIDFESRKSKFNELMMALEDGNNYMIGLQGMGGSGKTTLATQVGKQVEESKAFKKVIFTIVSTPPDIKKIQGDIARQLGLNLEEKNEVEHSKLLWSTIGAKSVESEGNEGKSVGKKGKLLIILDDVWEELNLKDIGIPYGQDHKNCYVLVTTRNLRVCNGMGCQRIVHLHTLTDEDALNLFLTHAKSNDDSSSHDLKGIALDIVKECGGLPVAIMAIASTLKNWPVREWKVALATLKNSRPLLNVDEDLVKVYNCLQLSYDSLRNSKAQKLFLLCSLFPEDYEIPVSLFIRLGIGAGIFGEVEKYCDARSPALGIKNELIASSLLLEAEKGGVKMHDLVREVALWIAKEDIQVIMDSRITLKTEKRYVFCSAHDFPSQFEGTELEILFLWINGNVLVKSTEAFFARLTKLKVLFLLCKYGEKFLPPSLSLSPVSLKNIQSIIMNGWKLDDFSIIGNLQSLETLELENCLMTELPKEVMKLKKLRLLGLRKCEIEGNNPFEVIGACSQLEELYFVDNIKRADDYWEPINDEENRDEIAHDVSLELQMYSVACWGFKFFDDHENGLFKCFNTKQMKNLISEAMFKYLVGSAEVLEFREIEATRWKSLVPDIIPMEDGGIKDLIKLALYEGANMECLIDTRKLSSDVLVFSKLVELILDGVDVKELYWGPMPSDFLKQLQILKLHNCEQLQNIFFDGNLKLPHLKVLHLVNCPMFQPSIFQLSVARSLVQLEELQIGDCEKLKTLISSKSSGEEIMDVGGLLFPKLKYLIIVRCDKLKLVLPLLLAGDLPILEELSIDSCKELEYIFGEYRDEGQALHQEIMLPRLAKMGL